MCGALDNEHHGEARALWQSLLNDSVDTKVRQILEQVPLALVGHAKKVLSNG